MIRGFLCICSHRILLVMMTMMMMIYILWCSVCLSRKMSTSSWESPVTTWTTHNHPVQLRVSFDGCRLVFHGSMSVITDFQGFRFVFDFQGSRLVFEVQGCFFMNPGWFFTMQECFFYGFSGFQVSLFGSRMFFYGFSRFQVGFSWFQMGSFGYSRFQGGFSRFQVGFIVFQGKRYSLHLYLGPTIPLGLAGRRPALA